MSNTNSGKNKRRENGSTCFAMPFLAVLALLTVVAFIIPLRPTHSYMEKRALAQFPEFSTEALFSGSYFDDISAWFSDTFPGREDWINLSATLSGFHGVADISISGQLPVDVAVSELAPDSTPDSPIAPEATESPDPDPAATPEVSETPVPHTQEVPVIEEAVITEAPEAPIEEWGGVDAGEGANIILGTVVQIGDSAFSYYGFSEAACDKYIDIINNFANIMAEKGVEVVNVPVPTSVSVMVEQEYLDKLKCGDEGAAIDYINAGMNENVINVDMFHNLVEHNDEYIYFRTDHHWTALGAYYGYESLCRVLGLEPASLDSFELWDQGEYYGTYYFSCPMKQMLKADNVYAYNPPGDIDCLIYKTEYTAFEWTVLSDMRNAGLSTKYLTFLSGDHCITELTNNDLPNGDTCLVIKDSFGNPYVPFMTQNYYKVYAIDYREYSMTGLSYFVETHDVDQVIFLLPTMMAQGDGVQGLLRGICY